MVDQRVIDYINENLSRGISLQEIKQALINVGWQREEINSAIDLINQGSKDVDLIAGDYKKNISGKKGKKIILISIAIVIIFCVILGFFFYPKIISFGKGFSLSDLQVESMSLSLGGGPTIEGRYISLVSIGENDEITIEVDGVSETIEHSSKKIVNGVEIENIKIEDNGLAKIKINVLEPKSDDEEISMGDNEIIDCGSNVLSLETVGNMPNFDCFIEASENCYPAKLLNTFTMELFGTVPSSTTFMELKGIESGKCIYYQRIESYSVRFSDETVQQMLDSGITQEEIDEQEQIATDNVQEVVGMQKTCKFNTEDLTAVLNKWKKGSFSSGTTSCKLKSDGTSECTTEGGDFGAAECEGDY